MVLMPSDYSVCAFFKLMSPHIFHAFLPLLLNNDVFFLCMKSNTVLVHYVRKGVIFQFQFLSVKQLKVGL